MNPSASAGADVSSAGRSEVERVVQALERRVLDLEAQNQRLHAAQVEVEESRRRSVDLFEFIPVAAYTLDREGCIQEANAAGARLLGRERASILQCPFTSVARLEDPGAFRSHLHRALETSDVVTEELRLRASAETTLQAVSQRRVAPSGAATSRMVLLDVSDRPRAAETQEGVGRSRRARSKGALWRAHAGMTRQRASSVRWIAEQMATWGKTLRLTQAERAVAQLVVLGLSNKEIAGERRASIATIRAQVSSAFKKANATSRGEFAFYFFGSMRPVGDLGAESPQTRD